MALLKQSTIRNRMFKMISSTDHFTLKATASPVVNLSKNAAAFGAAAGAVSEVANGWYSVALSAADTNTLGDLAFYITGTGADDTDFVDQVSARIEDDLASPTNITAGTITTVTNLTNAPTSGDLTAAMKTSVENAVLNADMTGHQTLGTLGQAVGDPVADTNTIYKAVVTDATGATVGVDVVAVQADTDDIQTRLPAALVGGRIDASVGAVAANAITAAAIANGAIDAATFAAGAIDAAALAADAGAEIAAAVWDLDATAHQTLGTFGQAIGDPVADTNTIYKAVVTDATGATVGVDVVAVQADTDDIQARLPAALTANGNMKASLVEILTTALTETVGLLAGGFKKFFNVAAPTGTLNSIPDAVAGATGGLFIAGTNAATTITGSLTTTFTGNLTGSVASVTGAVGSVTAAVTVGTINANVITAAAIADGAIDALTFAAGAIDAAAIAANAIGASELAADAVTEIRDSILTDATAFAGASIAAIKAKTDSLTFTVATLIDANILRLNGVAASAANLEKSANTIRRGAVDVAPAPTTTAFADTANLTEAANDHWKGRIIIFTSGTLKDQATDITAYTGASKLLTFTALTAAPAAGDTYCIV